MLVRVVWVACPGELVAFFLPVCIVRIAFSVTKSPHFDKYCFLLPHVEQQEAVWSPAALFSHTWCDLDDPLPLI